MGAAVTLILGPSAEEITDSSIHVIKVESAEQMLNACLANFNNKNIVVCSAAVADYKPEHINAQKIKKKDETLRLNLIKTVDIVAQLGKQKTTQCLIGFALETENLIAYATDKLRNKNLDIIIANTTSTENTVFGSDTNEITIIDKHNKITNFELNTKHAVASHIVNYIIEFIRPQTQ
jgi:phosphopantothenoylcysteine decarboxylase/phosphopantothenate--cysteine ligase